MIQGSCQGASQLASAEIGPACRPCASARRLALGLWLGFRVWGWGFGGSGFGGLGSRAWGLGFGWVHVGQNQTLPYWVVAEDRREV